ncbi:DUF4442 domain-containing protein [Burkholderiaceae bacterium DAT-1]|nr:DUF4442 domain-containing protein [Burkholderiaceae bacterium DAT-1]
MNLWPPFLFTGITTEKLAADYREAVIALKLHWYNRNAVGVHYGGSLFSMTDAWYVIMLMHNLGKDYFVWDKHASIDYISPGKGIVRARFHLSQAQIDEIRDRTANGEKYLPQFSVEVIDEQGELVARVVKTLYIRRKPNKR